MAGTTVAGLPLDVAGFEGRGLAVRPAGLWRGAALVCDGAPVRRTGAAFGLNDNSGARVAFRFGQVPFDPIPKVIVRDQVIVLAPPLAWYQYAWAALPIALIVLGGLLGGLAGAAAFANLHIMRQPGPPWTKYAISGLVTFGAFVAYLLAASLFLLALHGT
jgi:hypothetical protein